MLSVLSVFYTSPLFIYLSYPGKKHHEFNLNKTENLNETLERIKISINTRT